MSYLNPIYLYRHRENSTIAYQILKQFYVKEKDIHKLKVMVWNIGNCHTPWCMSIVDKFELTTAKLKEFEKMSFGDKLSDSEFNRLCVGYNVGVV
jgi:hypothetical protein